MEDKIKIIGESLYRFQSAINESGATLEDYIVDNYSGKWVSDELYNVMAIRTSFVNSMNQFLVKEGLFNLEKVMLSDYTMYRLWVSPMQPIVFGITVTSPVGEVKQWIYPNAIPNYSGEPEAVNINEFNLFMETVE